MSTGKGIAIVGVWISVAVSSFSIGLWTIGVALCAAAATYNIVESQK